MKLRAYLTAFPIFLSLTPAALAQFDQSRLNSATANEQYVPRLGDIMSAVQTRHAKLWLAGKAVNWELAAYELRLLKAGLLEAATLYEGIPVTNITTMSAPVHSIVDAIEAKDSKRFAKAMGELTDGCNSCHTSIGRDFIVMRIPSTDQPFSNQVFPRQGQKP
jgi:hypothetical protein